MKSSIKLKILISIISILFVSCTQELEESKTTIANEPAIEEAFTSRAKEVVTFPNGISLEKIDSLFILEGDIILSKEQAEELGKVNTRSAYLSDSRKYWNDQLYQIVFYDMPSYFIGQYKVQQAITHWEANTSLRFWERIPAINKDYISFTNGDGNWSNSIGRKGGLQMISLDKSDSDYGTAIHEIGHAVGLFHEQSRTDRDNYITIHWGNIEDQRENNFKTFAQLGYQGNNLNTFDFNSIMLYPSTSFSKNGLPTITKKNGDTFGAQRQFLSTGDKAAINKMYPGRAPNDIICIINRHWTEYFGHGGTYSQEYTYTEYIFQTKYPVTNDSKITITIREEGGGSGQEYYPLQEHTEIVTIPRGSRSAKFTILERNLWQNGYYDWYQDTKEIINISYPFSSQ